MSIVQRFVNRPEGEPITGVELLREIWNISDESPRKAVAPADVCTDIYNTRGRGNTIPRRSRHYR